MASETSIANLALRHLGVSQEIQALETDRSEDASACRAFYDIALEEMFRDTAWPFATKILALGLVTDENDDDHPTEEWAYSYRYPSDCKYFRKIQSGTRNETRQTKIPFRIAKDDDGKLIFTDEDEAIGEWTVLVDDPEQYPADFLMAFSFLLASYIAPAVTKGDPFKLGQRAYEIYLKSIGKARANSFNEQQDEEDNQSEFIRGRD